MYTDLLVSIILKNYRINNSFFEEKSPNFFVFIKKFLQIFVQNHKKEKKQLDKEGAAWYYKQAVARSMESTGSGSGVPCKLNNGKHVKNTKDNFGEESCSERCQ